MDPLLEKDIHVVRKHCYIIKYFCVEYSVFNIFTSIYLKYFPRFNNFLTYYLVEFYLQFTRKIYYTRNSNRTINIPRYT